jgi:hypothetical protein
MVRQSSSLYGSQTVSTVIKTDGHGEAAVRRALRRVVSVRPPRARGRTARSPAGPRDGRARRRCRPILTPQQEALARNKPVVAWRDHTAQPLPV